MLHDSITSSMTSNITCGHHEDGNDNSREKSVFAAASALASLGVTSPSPTFRGRISSSSSSISSPMNRYHQATRMPASSNAFVSNDIMVSSENDVAASSYAPSPGPYRTVHDTGSSNNDVMEHDDIVLSLGSPPPNLNDTSSWSAIQPASREMSAVARPFASLLEIGSDIPLTFPQKLMQVLADTEISDVVTWLPHGKGFIILHKCKFSIDIMPRHFKHSKFTSFTRKLNRWGFIRVPKGPEMGAYYHKYFQRDDHLLCMQMRCKSQKKTSSSPLSSVKGYTMMDYITMDTNATASPPPTSPKGPTSRVPDKTLTIVSSHERRMISAPMSPMLQPDPQGNEDQTEFGKLASAARRRALLTERVSNVVPNTREGASSFMPKSSIARHETTHPEKKIAKPGNEHHHLQHFQHESHANSAFDSVFRRHQEILHQGKLVQGRGVHNSDQFQFSQGNEGINQFQASPMQAMNKLPIKSCMRRQPPMQQHSRQGNSVQEQGHQPRHFNHLDDTAVIRKLTDKNSAPLPGNCPLATSYAMNVIKSYSDQALLTALITKEYSHDKSLLPQGGGSVSGVIVQSQVHAAMQAQIRQLKEYNREKRDTPTTMDSISTVQDNTHAAMLAQIHHIERINNARADEMGGNEELVGADMKAAPLMEDGQMLQNEVTQIFNKISVRVQQPNASSASNDSTNHHDERSNMENPWAVRRASAA